MGDIPLTKREEQENAAHKAARECVEWSYGDVVKLWDEANDWENRRLVGDPDDVLRTIRVLHLLTNCFNCLNGGSSTSSYYRCPPPTLDEYLTMHL